MNHIKLTNKKDQLIVIHKDALKEAFPAADMRFTVLVIDVKNKDKEDSYLLVRESTKIIFEMLQQISGGPNE